MMAKYNLPAIPVIDENNRLLGRVTFDDIMDVMETESTEDLLKIVGVSEDESLRGSWLDAVKSRLPWLLINVITASTAGLVVSLFSGTLEKLVVLASYMPVIAGVAGNGATQALAVTIRRLATDGIPVKRYFSVIFKEVSVGLINGAVIGGIVSLVAIYTQANPMLGLVVFMAMVGNLLIAGMAGSAVPLLLQRINIDPAVASSILITAFTDILGYSLLLGFATWLLL
jgi:magnesium transporter